MEEVQPDELRQAVERLHHCRATFREIALALAVLGAATMAEAAGKPAWAPPSNPPDTLLDYACSLLPSAAAAWVPFCQ